MAEKIQTSSLAIPLHGSTIFLSPGEKSYSSIMLHEPLLVRFVASSMRDSSLVSQKEKQKQQNTIVIIQDYWRSLS